MMLTIYFIKLNEFQITQPYHRGSISECDNQVMILRYEIKGSSEYQQNGVVLLSCLAPYCQVCFFC